MKRVAITLCLALMTGCHHGGTAPPGWQGAPFKTTDLDTTPGDTHPRDHGNHAETQARLLVLICYGKVLSNHVALRLESPGKPTLLWDPGGTWHHDDPTYDRRHDVLTKNAPDVDDWWRYRRDGCREPVMEAFEWSITPGQAQRLHGVLLNHRDPLDAEQRFEPDAGGLQCSTRVSEFLMRFSEGRPNVSRSYFWPHKLAEHLWTQQPDRVWVYRAHGGQAVYQGP